jgi:hypothetical protein
MREAFSIVVSAAVLGFMVWGYAGMGRRLGGWKWIRETGADWFLALSAVSFAALMYLSTKPAGISREPRVLLGLASMALFGGALLGFVWRMQSTQSQRFRAACARLREDGFLAAGSAMALDGSSSIRFAEVRDSPAPEPEQPH